MAVAQMVLNYFKVFVWPCFWLIVIFAFKSNISLALGALENADFSFAGFSIKTKFREVINLLETENLNIDPYFLTLARRIQNENARKKNPDTSARSKNAFSFETLSSRANPEQETVSALLEMYEAIEYAARLLNVEATRDESNTPGSGGAYLVQRRALRDLNIINLEIDSLLNDMDLLYRKIWLKEESGPISKWVDKYISLASKVAQLIIARALAYQMGLRLD